MAAGNAYLLHGAIDRCVCAPHFISTEQNTFVIEVLCRTYIYVYHHHFPSYSQYNGDGVGITLVRFLNSFATILAALQMRMAPV